MNEIILQVAALKIENDGGGVMRRIDYKESKAYEKTDSGTDYVVFVCPHPKCGRRNKQSVYEVGNYVPADKSGLPFRCKICRRPVEVSRPRVPTKLIMDPDEFTKEMAQRRRNLAVNRTKLGRP